MLEYIIMNAGSPGFFNRQIYDNCNFSQRIQVSTDPLLWHMYQGAYENCGKCTYNGQFNVPFQPSIVDVESELLNLTRPLSDCNNLKYNPKCSRSGMCVSTFDRTVPVVLAPEVCPIIFNNIPRQTNKGYTLPNPNFCGY
jgi:hypothetical protein